MITKNFKNLSLNYNKKYNKLLKEEQGVLGEIRKLVKKQKLINNKLNKCTKNYSTEILNLKIKCMKKTKKGSSL